MNSFASPLLSYGVRHVAGKRTPPLPVFNERIETKGMLFTHPCGTPLDLAFSDEVLSTRKAYWSTVITRLGGRIIPLKYAEELGTACIIVPDSRLWLPSACTVELIAKETFTSSVVGEEWLEMCYHRAYILPPAYVRMKMVAEYIRMGMAPHWHTDRVQRLALIPGEWEIPTTANTGRLQDVPHCFNILKFFSSPVCEWYRESPLTLNLTDAGNEMSVGCIFLASIALGSPYEIFDEEKWDMYFWTEVTLVRSTKSLFRKVHGYWPCQPFDQTPYADKPIDEAEAIKVRGRWIKDHEMLMDFNQTDTSKLPNRSTATRLGPETLSIVKGDDGMFFLGVLPGQKRTGKEDRNPSQQEVNDSFDQEVLSELQKSDTLQWATTAASLAAAKSMEAAATEIAREEAARLAPEESLPFETPTYEEIRLDDYVGSYEQIFASPSPRHRYKVARSLLTGLKMDAVNTRYRIQNPPQKELKANPDLSFGVDIDSAWASFRAKDGWKFHSGCTVQLFPSGPWGRRVIGSSKFRIDPGDGTCLDWGARVPMHHFANTEFLTVGPKTSIYAVFPRLRDVSKGHKFTVLSPAQEAAWYDCVVRPAAVRVFGGVVERHWALTHANYLWRDRRQGRLSHSKHLIPQSDGDSMTKFLRTIDQFISEGPKDSIIPDFAGICYVIQCQNDKLQYRQDDVLTVGGGDRNPHEFTEAIERVQEMFFDKWNRPLPRDTHVDIGLEISCRDPTYSPYILSTGHPIMLQDTLQLTPDAAEDMVRLAGRKSEHHQYHRHDVACLPSIAGFDWTTQSEHTTQIRAIKTYHTEKGFTFKRQAPKNLQQPAKSCWTSNNVSLQSHFRNMQSTLRSTAHSGANAIRIEFTLPQERVLSCNIFPTAKFFRHIAKLDMSLLARYRSLKLKAIQCIHTHMVGDPSFQGILKRAGPLSILAILRWYHEALFTRVSPLFWKDQGLFAAMCGTIEPEILSSNGQLVFESSLLPNNPEHCPTVPNPYVLDNKALIAQFGVKSMQELEKLVEGSGRPKGKSKARQSLGEILEHTILPSAPLSNMAYPDTLTGKIDIGLGDMEIDTAIEAIFVGMVRAVWYSVPSTRQPGKDHQPGKDTPVIATHITVDDVRYQWGPQELRKAPAVIMRYFRAVTWDEKSGNAEWTSTYNQLFGEMKGGHWSDETCSKGAGNLAYHAPWKTLMEGHCEDSLIQTYLYRLMFAKFNTLQAFPKLQATGIWQKKKLKIDGRLSESDRCVVLLRSPHTTGLGDIWRAAGYTGIHEVPEQIRLSMTPEASGESLHKQSTKRVRRRNGPANKDPEWA